MLLGSDRVERNQKRKPTKVVRDGGQENGRGGTERNVCVELAAPRHYPRRQRVTPRE